MKELDVVRLKRAIDCWAQMPGGITIRTQFPAGLDGTIVDWRPGNDRGLVEHVNPDGSGFLFAAGEDDLELVEPEPEDARRAPG